MTRTFNRPQRIAPRPKLHLLAVGLFASVALWLGWDSADARDNPRKKATKVNVAVASLTAGKKVDVPALARLIDQQIVQQLLAEGVKAAPRSDDAEFLRRIYLDLVGVVPTAENVQAFLDSKDVNKRAAVIEEVWSGLLLPHDSTNRRLKEAPFISWLADNFNANKPLDKLVYELLSSTGNQDENGAVTFFIANSTVDKMTDCASRVFLGVQLQCAQCHNHPFTDWKQTEYWGMAAFFMKTKLTVAVNQAAKKGIPPGISETAKGGKKKQVLPESAKLVPAKFLQGEEPKLNTAEPYRPVLAQWVTAPENQFFARAMVNRFWYQLFGRGLVSPVDDMHADNAAAHPELLATLTEQLKLNNFDLKYLVRAICNSEAYQRSSKVPTEGSVDPDLYAQRLVRTLTPEQLHDSLMAVLRTTEGRSSGKAKGGKKGPLTGRENFLAFFRVEDPNPLDYQAGIPQALRLMNSGISNNLNAAVAAAMSSPGTPPQVVERLYLSALSRRPSADEARRMSEYLGRQSDPRAAYGDILWALLNTSEFVLNH
jgi:hypothetical protein